MTQDASRPLSAAPAAAVPPTEQEKSEDALRAKYSVPKSVLYPKREDGSYQSRSLNQTFEGWELAQVAQPVTEKRPAPGVDARADFEREMGQLVSSLTRDLAGDGYQAPDAHRAWLAWQNATDLAVRRP